MVRSESAHDRLLLTATQALISENGWPPDRVVAAVAQAKQAARDLYASCGLELPAGQDYVAMIIASARHRLEHHGT